MSKCILKNFKECYRQEVSGEDPKDYNYLICTACLLSRIEKTLFNHLNPKEKQNVQEDGRTPVKRS